MPSFLQTSVSSSPNLECSLNKTFYDATWALNGIAIPILQRGKLRHSELKPGWGFDPRFLISTLQICPTSRTEETQKSLEFSWWLSRMLKKKKILFLSYFMGVYWNVLGVHQFPKYSLSTPTTVQGQFPVSLETLALLVDSVSWWELMKPPCKKQPKSHVSNANRWTLGLCLNASHGHLLPLFEERRPPLRINNPPKTRGSIPYW